MSLRFTPGSRYRTNAAKSPLLLDENVTPYWTRSLMLTEAKRNGQTVFMSSHVMSEVQQTADRVGIVREGVLVAVERVEDLRERGVRRVEIHFEDPVTVELLNLHDAAAEKTA